MEDIYIRWIKQKRVRGIQSEMKLDIVENGIGIHWTNK